MRGLSFSWKRALGISSAKARISREIGVPLTSSGRQRKIGRMASGWLSSLLVESAYQTLKPSGKRSRRASGAAAPAAATPEVPRRPPSIAATVFACFGGALVGGIVALIFQSPTAFWVVTALYIVILFAERHERAKKWREYEASLVVQPPLQAAIVERAVTARDVATVPQMLAQLASEQRPIDRHFLMLGIVESAYRDRTRDPAMRDLCERIGLQHVAEFPAFMPALRSEFGMTPRVPTFQLLATVLTERREFARAIDVCQTALSFGLHDNTVGGFEGRIERIRKKQAATNP